MKRIISLFFAIMQKGKNTIVKGVSARNIELSNLTTVDAKEKIATEINKEMEIPIKLKYNEYSLDLKLSDKQKGQVVLLSLSSISITKILSVSIIIFVDNTSSRGIESNVKMSLESIMILSSLYCLDNIIISEDFLF